MTHHINSLRGAVMVWLISYIFFLLTLANNFSASHDSIHYLNGIVSGKHLFHPHHLLYHYYAHLWWLLFGNIFKGVPDFYIIESFTAIWGSGILAVCYLFFRSRFFLTRGMSAFGVTLIAFSFGVWFYSVNIEVYTPPIFFTLCSLFIISRKEPSSADVWKVAILHSFAMLFHQVNILFTAVVIYWLFVHRGRWNMLQAFARYAVVAVIITGLVYVVCGAIYEEKHSLAAFTDWVLGYTQGHSYWQPLSGNTPLHVLAGFSRAFIGGHFIFQHPALADQLQESFSAHGLRDEHFLGMAMSPVLVWLLTILVILFITTMIVMAVRFAAHYQKMQLHFNIIHPVLVTLAVYSLFFLFWMPEILEFWILQMVLVWLLLAGMLPVFRFPFRLSPMKGLFVLCLVLFIVNYYGSIRWLQQGNRDWYQAEINKLDKTLSPADIIIVEDEWILKDYARRFSRAQVIATDEPGYSRDDAQKKVSEAIAARRRVFVYRNGWQAIRSY